MSERAEDRDELINIEDWLISTLVQVCSRWNIQFFLSSLIFEREKEMLLRIGRAEDTPLLSQQLFLCPGGAMHFASAAVHVKFELAN